MLQRPEGMLGALPEVTRSRILTMTLRGAVTVPFSKGRSKAYVPPGTEPGRHRATLRAARMESGERTAAPPRPLSLGWRGCPTQKPAEQAPLGPVLEG